ncbi:MAG: protoglobin domain-containing protein [Leptothrix sp. (in: b-proteobacteria)]
MDLFKLTDQIIATLPENQRFSDKDSALLLRFKDQLLSLEDEVVKGFYDEIEENPHMSNLISANGSRADREKTLRRFWQRTFNGNHDASFWAWQSLVGIVHIKVGVKNPMMMGMWQWIVSWLRERLTVDIVGDEQTLKQVMASVERLALTAQVITAESYLLNYLETVVRLTGFKPALLQRMFDMEINTVLAEARQQLGHV